NGARGWAMKLALPDLAQHLASRLGDRLVSHQLAFGELTLAVKPEAIVEVLSELRNHGQVRFEVLIDLCGVDYPERPQRFDVVYHLLSPRLNQRLRVKCMTDETTQV